MADSPRPSAIKCNDKARTPAAQASRHADMQLQPSAGGPSKHRAPGDSRPAMRGAGTDDCMSEPQTTHARRSSHWPQSTTLLARARARARDTHTSRALPYIKRVRFADSPRTSLRGHRVKFLLFAPEASGHTVPTLNRNPMRPPRRLDSLVSGRESRLVPGACKAHAPLSCMASTSRTRCTARRTSAARRTSKPSVDAPTPRLTRTVRLRPQPQGQASLTPSPSLSPTPLRKEYHTRARARALRCAQRAKVLPGSAARRAGVPGPAAAGAAQNGPAPSLQSSSPRGRPRTGPPAHPTRPRAALPAARRGRGALQAEPSAI